MEDLYNTRPKAGWDVHLPHKSYFFKYNTVRNAGILFSIPYLYHVGTFVNNSLENKKKYGKLKVERSDVVRLMAVDGVLITVGFGLYVYSLKKNIRIVPRYL